MKITLFFLCYLGLLIKVINKESPEIQFIISATLNGTSPTVSLSNFPGTEKYMYFSFDFAYHYKIQKKYRNIVYFLIVTSIDFEIKDKSLENSIGFGFLDKKWNEIISTDIEDLEYSKILTISKKRSFGEFQYQIKIKTFFRDVNTLIIRVPRLGYNTGYFSIQNILKLLKN